MSHSDFEFNTILSVRIDIAIVFYLILYSSVTIQITVVYDNDILTILFEQIKVTIAKIYLCCPSFIFRV